MTDLRSNQIHMVVNLIESLLKDVEGQEMSLEVHAHIMSVLEPLSTLASMVEGIEEFMDKATSEKDFLAHMKALNETGEYSCFVHDVRKVIQSVKGISCQTCKYQIGENDLSPVSRCWTCGCVEGYFKNWEKQDE